MNNKKSIITIAGVAGSGKTANARLLATRLSFDHYSMGDMQRKTAQRKGISLAELGELQKRDPTLDREIDQEQQSLGNQKDYFVIDSRLGWYFIPQSFKVFLKVPKKIAVERIWKDIQQNPGRQVEQHTSKEELAKSLLERVQCEKERYQVQYGIMNHYDESHFDIVIDTSNHSVEEVAAIIKQAYEKWKAE